MRKSPSLVSSPAALRRLRQVANDEAGSERQMRRTYSLNDDYSSINKGHVVDVSVSDKTTLLAPIGSTIPSPGRTLQTSHLHRYGTQPESPPAVVEVAPPLLSHWLLPALLCALAYALYNLFIKKGSASIHPVLGGVILQFVAAMIGLVLLLLLMYGPAPLQSQSLNEEWVYDGNGIWYAVLAGVSVGIAEIISFAVNGMGVQATQSIPIIIGGSVFFGTILGKVFLEEDLSLSGWLGVAMIGGGIILVATDPKAAL